MVQNALRKEVNRLNEENDKLAKEITVLEQQVQRISEKETELENITQQQNINSNAFVQLCNTNRVTLDELKVTLLYHSSCTPFVCSIVNLSARSFYRFIDCNSG
jgi:SMC interacting uncharacterized protein involved in chromosome segregation